MCEKPLALTWREAKEMFDVARQEGKLMEKAVQVDLIVDMVEIGFSFDDIQFVLHIHASVSAACSTSLGLVVSSL